jgi:hypothetical protein
MVRGHRPCAMNGSPTTVSRLVCGRSLARQAAAPVTGSLKAFYARVGPLRAKRLETLKLSRPDIRMNSDIRKRAASRAI